MAVTTTSRFGITRWSAGTDPFSRAQMDTSHAQIEALGAIYGQGTLAARPAQGVAGRYYTVRGDTAANNGRVFYDDGTAWFEVGANGMDQTARASAAGAVALTVVGFTGQTAKLTEWRTSTNALVGSVGADGSVAFTGAATFAGLTTTTLTASGAAVLQSTLVVTGAATFSSNVTVNGTLKAASFKSTSARASGLAKTELNDDGTGRMDALIPPGFYMCSLRADVPAGWLRMEGQTVNVATYPDLHLALGQPGGAGATTFVIPDWRDRTTVGVSATKALMSTGGSATMTLTVNHLPSHTHDISHTHTHAHTHDIDHTHQFPHTHTINHDHPAATTSAAGNHSHGNVTGANGGTYYGAPTGVLDGYAGFGLTIAGSYVNRPLVGNDNLGYESHSHSISADGNHTHTFDVPSYAGSSGGASTTTTTSQSTGTSGAASTATTSAPSAANSGSAGSGTSFSVQDPYGAGYWVIKT